MENPLKDLKPNQKKILIGTAAVAGLYVAYRWYTRGASGEDPVPTVTDSTDGDLAGTGIIGSNVGGGENVGNSTGGDDTQISTNDKWFSEATDRLSGQGGFSAGAVQSALGDFLTGQKLTEDEARIVRAAVGAMGGYPPGGPSSITVIPGVTDASKLQAPTGLKAVATNPTTVTLTWNKVPDATNYRIYRNGVAQNVGTSATGTAQIGGLTPGTSYTFYVAGAVGDKAGPRSAGATVKTGAQSLSAPKGLKVVSKNANSVTLSWTPQYPGQYLIQQSGRTSLYESVDAVHRIDGLTPGKRYSFRVASSQPSSRTPGPYSGYISVTLPKK